MIPASLPDLSPLRGRAVLRHLKRGDWMILSLGILFTTLLPAVLLIDGAADTVRIRSGGKIFSEAPLSRNQVIDVPGPLGTTRVAIHNLQARIVSDPSPRQYCVRQGWLSRAGEIGVCLPNQVSLELLGSESRYDSLNY